VKQRLVNYFYFFKDHLFLGTVGSLVGPSVSVLMRLKLKSMVTVVVNLDSDFHVLLAAIASIQPVVEGYLGVAGQGLLRIWRLKPVLANG
jgi:hypothetical protein